MALTAVAHWTIDAAMHAAAIFGGTFIDATFTRGLVFAIGTILLPVTNLGQGNTLIASAIKLTGGVAALGLSSESAILLVGAVRTVPLTVARKMTRNAAAIPALELIRAAGDVLAVGRILVVAVGAVAVAVAKPAVVQAGDAILALILVRQAGGDLAGGIRAGLSRGGEGKARREREKFQRGCLLEVWRKLFVAYF